MKTINEDCVHTEKISMEVRPKTIYTDIVGMPDPMLLGLTIHYYNHSDGNLYMKIFGSGPSPWSSNSVALELLNSGGNAYINLDNFLSRTKPASETTEQITLTLRGYSDSGYSNLVYEFARNTTVVFIKSNDGSWTQDFLNNFDDGTVQGWAQLPEKTGHGSDAQYLTIATDYVLSTPYSLKMKYVAFYNGINMRERRERIYKSFTTPNRNTVYAILNVRVDAIHGCSGISYRCCNKYLRINSGDTTLIHIGRQFDNVTTEYFPRVKWMRFVVPLPKSTTLEFRIVVDVGYAAYSTAGYEFYFWLDDFQIISK